MFTAFFTNVVINIAVLRGGFFLLGASFVGLAPPPMRRGTASHEVLFGLGFQGTAVGMFDR